MNVRATCGALAAILCFPWNGIAESTDNWPAWRGPAGVGVGAAGNYPAKFSAEKGLAWKVDLPGKGSSTPAVWGDKIFVTCGAEGKDCVVCYDLAGHELWNQPFGEETLGKHRNGSGSNPSPATDGKHVVVMFKSGELACLDLAGKISWQANLQDKFGPFDYWWDFGTSPVLVGDLAVVAVMHAKESYLAAYRLDTGELAWKQLRQYQCAKESDQAYTTPQLVDDGTRQVLVVWGADRLTGHDPRSGEKLWEIDGFNPENKINWRVIASAAVADGVAVIPYARGEALTGVRLPKSGETGAGAFDAAWKTTKLGADVPTPVVAAGKVYLLGDDGRVACLDLNSGAELWAAALPKNRNHYFASPVLAGDLLYATREDGVITVGRVGQEFTQLAENDMQEQIIASPVPVRGGLLIRGAEHLFHVAPVAENSVARTGR